MEKEIHVLLVEDSEDDALLLVRELRRAGYAPSYERVDTAATMNDALARGGWDIIVADYVMPQFSGSEALKLVQQKGLDVPFIIVSGRIGEDIAVDAMKAGAHDYIMKTNLKRLGPTIERELAEAKIRSERKNALEMLQRREAELTIILEQTPCILWTTDRELRFTSNLGAGFSALELKPNQLQGKSLYEYMHADSAENPVIAAHQRALDGVPNSFELVAQDRTFYCHVRPLHDAGSAVTGVIGVGLNITARKRAEDGVRTLAHRLLDVQEEERRTVARELHDQLAQSLTALKLLLYRAGNLPGVQGTASLVEAQTLADELINRVHDLSLNLRPAMLDNLGLLPALLWHFERYTAQTKLHINFAHYGLDRQFPPQVNTVAYRIVQEALTNVVRHARVTEVDVRAWADDETLCIQIRDAGVGFDPLTLDGKLSSGVNGMRERAELLGGSLTVQSSPGTGTIIFAELPLGEKAKGVAEDVPV